MCVCNVCVMCVCNVCVCNWPLSLKQHLSWGDVFVACLCTMRFFLINMTITLPLQAWFQALPISLLGDSSSSTVTCAATIGKSPYLPCRISDLSPLQGLIAFIFTFPAFCRMSHWKPMPDLPPSFFLPSASIITGIFELFKQVGSPPYHPSLHFKNPKPRLKKSTQNHSVYNVKKSRANTTLTLKQCPCSFLPIYPNLPHTHTRLQTLL